MPAYYILAVFGALVFFQAFFPITDNFTEFKNEPPTHVNNVSLRKEYVYSTSIKKTVLIIVDALRLDFVDPHYMPLTSNITKRYGCFNKIIVETPTVTLPRIKAFIAGSVPQFIDLVLNLASTEVLKDSLIHSAYKKRKRMVFYGDNTWLKLFPVHFVRHEGTSSFFVRDFKEVDDNVTRNVIVELQKEDWDVMILHYLGLDHIGHVYGPFSSLISGKLKEMDEIVNRIYTELSAKNKETLLVITGDHGMRDSGGHGGSTYSETNVPLLMVGLQCTNDSFAQTDVPVNLAVLLGLNIPSSSIGRLRYNLLPITLEKYLYASRYNALLLQQKHNICADQFDQASALHEAYLRNYDNISAARAIDIYNNCSSLVSERLMNASVKQNLNPIIISILVMFNTLLILVKKLLQPELQLNWRQVFEYLLILVILFAEILSSNEIVSYLFMFVLFIFLFTNIKTLNCIRYKMVNVESVLLVLFVVVHPLTFVSSSFVEEEHQFWYFLSNFFIFLNLVIFLKNKNVKNAACWFSLSVGVRLLRTLNSTGDKWANYPDFSDWLLKDENFRYHQLFFILGLLAVFYAQCLLVPKKDSKIFCFNLLILSLVFIYKNVDSDSILLGKLIWCLIFIHLFLFYKYKVIAWTLVAALLLKPFNVILLAFCIFSSLSYHDNFKDTALITISHSVLGNTLFFAQGHSNSLASVDVSAGYVGLSEYNPLFVTTQVLCHIYTFPVLCHLLIFSHESVDQIKVWLTLFCFRLYDLAMVCVITLMHRYHLFIWSVFAPKLFIEMVHTAFLFTEFALWFCQKWLRLVLLHD